MHSSLAVIVSKHRHHHLLVLSRASFLETELSNSALVGVKTCLDVDFVHWGHL